jgi:GSCFA family
MAEHPYRSLPEGNFWKPSIAAPSYDRVDPVISGKFRIGRSDRVATAGSCFAQHIARHLQRAGFSYLVTEQPHPLVPAGLAQKYGYGLFTARYGNVYTSRQLLQLLYRAYGLFEPEEDFWLRPDGRVIDPFRPQIQPNGFASMAEYRADRRQHFAAVRRAIEELDVFVFTLGLTEGWVSRADGAAYPLCPGVAGGRFDPTRHAFLNLRVHEVIEDLQEAIACIRARNARARFILTVSPVPLLATAEPRSVLAATTYSKSVLRVAAEEIAGQAPWIAYFPSYEIVTGQHARGRYFADDLRSVTEEGVSRVMQLFFQHYADVGQSPASSTTSPTAMPEPAPQSAELRKSLAVMCDEEALERDRNWQADPQRAG